MLPPIGIYIMVRDPDGGFKEKDLGHCTDKEMKDFFEDKSHAHLVSWAIKLVKHCVDMQAARLPF